jgi:thiol:disulfide interchange protein DsbD
MLVSAFAGGILLNLMPCVLPVLSIKILGFAGQSQGSRLRLAEHGLLFAFGVLVSFAALAGMLLALRGGGAAVGWGFQLQSPLVVTLLAALMLLVALNLSGVFQVGHRLMGLAGSAHTPGGRLGPVFNGMLATLVASPCTAPFMGAALGYAAVQPAPVAFAVFMALALGFASPVLVLSLMPGWTRRLPRPGPWMERLRHWLALPMHGAALWLIWVLSQQLGSSAFAATLGALWLIGTAAWAWGQAQAGARGHGWVAGLAAAAGLALALGLDQDVPPAAVPGERALAWSPERVRALQAEGRPVFVNFTAAWCISCKVNERLALDRPGVRAAMAERDVAYLEGDWTRQDPAISAELARHGRNGVPLYLVYPPRPGGTPEVLPQLLTENLVLAALERL